MASLNALNLTLAASGYQLIEDQSEHSVSLASLNEKFTPLQVDFVSGKSRHRLQFGGGRGQPLARAAGFKKNIAPRIIDLTAGLGRDSFVLASLGAEIILVERNPVIAVLLQNGLDRALSSADTAISSIVTRMHFVHADSADYLAVLDDKNLPDTIYLDPMYPHRDKSALVKKEMRIFRDIVGEDEDDTALLALARSRALQRVVVKRPKNGEFLADVKPDFQIKSPNTRYDIYLPLE